MATMIGSALKRIHHVGISVGDAAEDRIFHEEVLGLRLASSTTDATDGRVHQLFDTGTGEPGTLISSLSVTASGEARRGSNAPKSVNLSVPPQALAFWRERLHEHYVESESDELWGQSRLTFTHPSGIGYSLVAVEGDERAVNPQADVPAEYAVRGLHSVLISLMDVREFTDFLRDLVGADHVDQDGGLGLFRLGDGPATTIEVVHEPYAAPGTWRFAPGTPHHVGFDVGSAQEREQLRSIIAAHGYPDISAESDGDGFNSMWFRAPGGILVDLVSVPTPVAA